MRVRDSLALEQGLHDLHTLENLLFLETSRDDMHADRQAVHIVRIVALVRIALEPCSAAGRTEARVSRVRSPRA
jgi:hypothetical protein